MALDKMIAQTQRPLRADADRRLAVRLPRTAACARSARDAAINAPARDDHPDGKEGIGLVPPRGQRRRNAPMVELQPARGIDPQDNGQPRARHGNTPPPPLALSGLPRATAVGCRHPRPIHGRRADVDDATVTTREGEVRRRPDRRRDVDQRGDA